MNPKGGAARYFARIVRAVVVGSLGFGGGIGLLTFIAFLVLTGKQSSLALALRAGTIFGIGFGFCFALVLLLSDISGRLFAAKGFHDEIWELNQAREIEYDGTLREARAISRKALLNVPNMKAVSDDDADEHRIKGSVGPSWKSPGEAMEIIITPMDNEPNRWRIKCTSSCLAPQVAFDYGKNCENVEAWLRTYHYIRTLRQAESSSPDLPRA